MSSELATRVTALTLLDPAGRPVTRVDMTPGPGGDVEIARADLSTTLHEAARDDVAYLFGDTVVDLRWIRPASTSRSGTPRRAGSRW